MKNEVTRTVKSDWYSGIEREYEVTVEVALDWHTQEIDSFDTVTCVDMLCETTLGNGGIIHLPLEILDPSFVESLLADVEEMVRSERLEQSCRCSGKNCHC